MTPTPRRDQLFISYSHADRDWVDRLQTMIRPLVRHHALLLWDDSQISPGAKWREEIEKALAAAKVALLLVSDNFLASEFVTNQELPPLLQAAEQEGLRILWVCLSPCFVEETPIDYYQALLPPGRFLDAMSPVEQKLALKTIAGAIRDALQAEVAPVQDPGQASPRSVASPPAAATAHASAETASTGRPAVQDPWPLPLQSTNIGLVNDQQKPHGWWETFPGFLTGFGALLAALTGLIVAFQAINKQSVPSTPSSGTSWPAPAPAPAPSPNPSPSPSPSPTSTQINISGKWNDPAAGSSFYVSQDGSKYQYAAKGAIQGEPFESSGNGTLNGQSFESSYTTQYKSGRWSEGRCYGIVSAVARQITSTCTDSIYGQYQSNLIRDR